MSYQTLWPGKYVQYEIWTKCKEFARIFFYWERNKCFHIDLASIVGLKITVLRKTVAWIGTNKLLTSC